METREIMDKNQKQFIQELQDVKKNTLWRISEAEDVLSKRISRKEVVDMIEAMDEKFEQSSSNLENKLLDRLLKAYKDQ